MAVGTTKGGKCIHPSWRASPVGPPRSPKQPFYPRIYGKWGEASLSSGFHPMLFQIFWSRDFGRGFNPVVHLSMGESWQMAAHVYLLASPALNWGSVKLVLLSYWKLTFPIDNGFWSLLQCYDCTCILDEKAKHELNWGFRPCKE